MSRFATRAVSTFMLLTIAGLFVTARAEDERHERAELIERLDREADELGELGRRDEAERIRARIQQLRDGDEAYRQRGHVEGELKELHMQLEQLHARQEELARTDNLGARREVEERIEAVKREIAQLEERHGDRRRDQESHEPEMEEIVHRIEHLHRAADHLAEAGERDLVHELHQRAEHMERELHARRKPAEGKHHEVHAELRELRTLVRELRGQVAELREHVNVLRQSSDREREEEERE